MISQSKSKEFYKWLVLGSCTCICFYAMGLTYNMYSMFQPGIEQEIGMTKAQSATIIAMIGGVASIGAIIGGRVYAKYGIRKWSMLFGLLMGAGYICLGMFNSVAAIYLVMIIVGTAYGAGSMVSAFTIINRWFYKSKGFMTGLASMGSGVATIICPFFINMMIGNLGVRQALLIHGLVIMTLVLLVTLIIRDNPQEKGLLPYGVDSVELAVKVGVPFTEARKSARYWLIILVCACNAGFIMPIMGQISSIVQDSGYSSSVGAMALSVLGAAMLVCKPMYGLVTDKWSIQFGHYLTDIAMILTILSGVFIKSGILTVIVFAFSSGVIATVSSVGPGTWMSRIYGNLDYEKCYSTATFVAFIFGGGFTLLSGVLRDMAGSFVPLYIVNTIFLIFSAVVGYMSFKEKETY